ncbi:Fasciculation and elongation protein zeta-2 [Liparis tanakae]|uniref:Fasciculation and elongation protein zeta-2 n=1 Tax=Liparis tanakae TaxID=230148 RepID=A0A4Z2IEL6_9TELE|nr:Fasciculation and elongation protein zeta-2 [Liparis tanakae]
MAAPVAHFDDDRPIVGDLSMVSDRAMKGSAGGAAAAAPPLLLDDGDLLELQDGGFSPRDTGAFRSSEDLVNEFDERLSACFRHCSPEPERVAPVDVMTEDSLLEKDELWKALTGNFGRVMPVDWKRSRTCSLHVPTFNLEKNASKTDVTELLDEEELREQLDMHSIIVSCLAEEPLFTAEQVIEEIEEMMQDSPEDGPNHSQSDLSMLSLEVQRSARSPDYESSVRTLSVAELHEHLEETEANIRMFSEELVLQLALRDELDFEKEVKNSFISALIDVQNRQKEHRELLKKKKKKLKGGAGTPQGQAEKAVGSRFSVEGISSVIQNSFRQTFGGGCSDRQGHPPSLEDLQILTKILQAMRDDSDKVPSLLTDYILKGERFLSSL